MSTTLRNIRIPDPLWDAAGRKAAQQNSTRSEIVRQLLTTWIEQENHQ